VAGLTATQVEAFAKDGYLVFENLLSDGELHDIKADLHTDPRQATLQPGRGRCHSQAKWTQLLGTVCRCRAPAR